VGVEIVLNEYDLFGVGEVRVGQFFENLSIVQSGVTVSANFDARDHHPPHIAG
jgi:hypothetical protein